MIRSVIHRVCFLHIALSMLGTDYLSAESASESKPSVRYCASADAQYVVRILPGDFNQQTAKANILRYNESQETYDHVCEIDLPNKYLPTESLVTTDGRYFVCLGNFSGFKDRSAAIAIFDLRSGTKKIFALDDIFTQEEIEKFVMYSPPQAIWFLTDFPFFRVDEDGKKIFLTAQNQNDELDISTVVVDLIEMSVSLEKPSFWKRQFIQRRVKEKRKEDWHYKFLTVEEERVFNYGLGLIPQNKTRPSIHISSKGTRYLFRMVPGDLTAAPKSIIMKYNELTKSFDYVQTVTLKNSVWPMLVQFSPNIKYLLTFDEFNTLGTTENAIVIYNLSNDKSKSFALEDFCSETDLESFASANNVRLWRIGNSWISLVGDNRDGWDLQNSRPIPSLAPNVIINLDKMEVHLAEPFRTNFRTNKKPVTESASGG